MRAESRFVALGAHRIVLRRVGALYVIVRAGIYVGVLGVVVLFWLVRCVNIVRWGAKRGRTGYADVADEPVSL